MKIAYLTSSLNDKRALERSVRAASGQSLPLKEIIVVDAGSTDGTLCQPWLSQVTLLQCGLLGVGTSVAKGLAHAQQQGHDWVWVMDQDSEPEPDALQVLVDAFEAMPAEEQARVGVLSSLCVCPDIGREMHGIRLTPTGARPAEFDHGQPAYDCDATAWAGSMYRMSVVREVGLPFQATSNWWEHYAMDQSDLCYGFRIRQAGYRAIMVRGSKVVHSVGRPAKNRWFRGRPVSRHAPQRLFVRYRNLTHFFWHDFPDRKRLGIFAFLLKCLFRDSAKSLLTERNPFASIRACVLGITAGIQRQQTRGLQ